MRTFHCDHCEALLFFENVTCLQCSHVLGFLPDTMDLTALEASGNDEWKSLGATSSSGRYRACGNGRDHAVCNWYVPTDDPEDLCVACRMNAVIPDVSILENLARWHKVEIAKRRLIYTLRKLSLSTDHSANRTGTKSRLLFRFLADAPGMPPVLTGHEGGVITLNIAEADDVEREWRRTQLHEPQRTLVGHFRHESGHYYWDALVAGARWQDQFRALFGDERADYAAALKAYYLDGPPADWTARCVSAYASAHPWEDWAETWAHYLHLIDSLETAAGFGLSLSPRHPAAPVLSANPAQVFGPEMSFDIMLKQWLPMTYAVNSLNRGLGLPDLYPFVLGPAALEKLRFIHEVVSRTKVELPPVSAAVTAPTAAHPSRPGASRPAPKRNVEPQRANSETTASTASPS